MNINWTVKSFKELTLDELHDLLALRVEVFVVEQNCPYQEIDGKDKVAFHVLGKTNKGDIVATARILSKGISYPEVAIGRVVTAKKIRELKKGNELMASCMSFIEKQFPNENVKLSAQSHLIHYYAKFGFVSTGKDYLEDNIPHTEMFCKIN